MWLLQTLNHKYETDVAFRVNVEELPSDIELDKEDTYFMGDGIVTSLIILCCISLCLHQLERGYSTAFEKIKFIL